LNGRPVNGTYTLYVYDFRSQNYGNLLSWSITVNSTKIAFAQGTTSTVNLRTGAAMDQNADGQSDQNPVTTPFTGLTPGDVYAAPMPAPAAAFTFNATNLIAPPFDQNTLPLILPAPYLPGTSAPNGTGIDNLVLNGTNSTLNVTFDRPMQVDTFTPDQVLQIMGPTGSLSDPQYYPSSAVGQTIPAATATGPGKLKATITVPN